MFSFQNTYSIQKIIIAQIHFPGVFTGSLGHIPHVRQVSCDTWRFPTENLIYNFALVLTVKSKTSGIIVKRVTVYYSKHMKAVHFTHMT